MIPVYAAVVNPKIAPNETKRTPNRSIGRKTGSQNFMSRHCMGPISLYPGDKSCSLCVQHAFASIAFVIGTFGPRSFNGAMPTTTSATTTYIVIDASSDPTMPRGIFFCGFFASSDKQLTISKPMYAKKTNPDPLAIPANPFGANGTRLSTFIESMPLKTTIPSMERLTSVMMELNLALSFAPVKMMNVHAAMRSADNGQQL
mmetsp:Transcript_8873/g.12643  ORF Transcript_8873/g.12643 Transcript_8873/m.12643 type:complete len:202 (+) Transcript_8873:933-1538(+)